MTRTLVVDFDGCGCPACDFIERIVKESAEGKASCCVRGLHSVIGSLFVSVCDDNEVQAMIETITRACLARPHAQAAVAKLGHDAAINIALRKKDQTN